MSTVSRKKKRAAALSASKNAAVVQKLLGNNSCAGCQFLYLQDVGYSNYTVTDTEAHCALDKNPALRTGNNEIPYDWAHDLRRGIYDRWELTRNGMCERYLPLPPMVRAAQFDVDGDTTTEEATEGLSGAARRAIRTHVRK